MSTFEVEDGVDSPPAPQPAAAAAHEKRPESSDSSDEEDMLQTHPYPVCVQNMDPELRRLLKLQFRGFRKHMVRAIERNMLDDLYALKVLFKAQIYGPFLEDLAFKPILKPAKIKDTLIAPEEDAPAERPAWIDKYLIPCRIAEGIINTGWFQILMVAAIVLAGLLVGGETYIECGYTSCREQDALERLPCGAETAPNAASCEAAGCCYVPAPVAVAPLGNATAAQNSSLAGACFQRGPPPECWHGPAAETTRDWMGYTNNLILLVFTAEVIMKILACKLRPWRYWMDSWNMFDFLIVLACWVPGGDQFAFLRLLRLMRLLKVLHFIHELQIILKGLVNGMESITYILLLLTLIFYLFAIVSVIAFSENDPVHFGSLDIAIVTLFRMSTMEDWTDIMYINMQGCMRYGYLGSSYCYDNRYCDKENQACDKDNPIATTGHGMPVAIFFVLFICVSGLVVMSLFIGVITTSMVEATSSAKQARKEEKWLAARAAIVAEFGDEGKKSARKSASSEASDGASSEAAALDADADAQGPGTCMDKYLAFGRFVKRIIDTKVFANTIIGCILAAAAIIGAQTYEALATQHEILFVTLDAFILAVFTLEVVLKIVALGKDWLGYFKEGWNIFDFAVVALCYMPFAGSAVAVLRLLRLLRVLKLFNNIKELQIILSGLAKGMSSVSYIGLLMFLLFYVFGIVALMFFRPNDPAHFPDLHGTMVTLFRCATMEDWTDVMYVSMYGCRMYHYGNDADLPKCENSEGFGLYAAIFWIVFIMLSSLVMLNLVVGVVCSAMTEATEQNARAAAKEALLQKVEKDTGIERAIIDVWVTGFVRLDDSEGYGIGNIRREDLDLVLMILGEEELLSHKMREHLFVRANHTVPLGMISLSDFIEALAKDLAMSRSKQDRHRRKLLKLEVRLTQVQEELSQTDSSQTQRCEDLRSELSHLAESIERRKAEIAKAEPAPAPASSNGITEDEFLNPLQLRAGSAADLGEDT